MNIFRSLKIRCLKKKKLAIAMAIGMSGFCVCPSVVAESTVEASVVSNVVSFQDVLEHALANNPDLLMAEARMDQALHSSQQFGSYRYPSVELNGSAGPEHNDPAPLSRTGHDVSFGRSYKLTVSKLLYDGGLARSEYVRGKRLQSAAEAETKVIAEELFLSVARYYMDYWRYQLELQQADGFVETIQELVSTLDAMYQGGAVSKLEVDFANARLASARGISTTAAAAMNNAFSELEYLAPGVQEFEAQPPESFSRIQLDPLTDYLEQGTVANSGFVTNQLSIEASQLRVAAQKARFKPTLNFELNGSVSRDEGGPTGARGKAEAKLLLSYTLYGGGERRGGVQRAEAQLRELEAEKLKLEREVFRSIDQSYNQITASRMSLHSVSDEIASSEELQRLNRKNLQLGTVSIIELIDGEERLFRARASRNEIMAIMHKEYLDLLIASGYVPEALATFLSE